MGNTMLDACIRAGVTLLEARCFMLSAAGESAESIAGALGMAPRNVREASRRAKAKLEKRPILVHTRKGDVETFRQALLNEARNLLECFSNRKSEGRAPREDLIDDEEHPAKLRGRLVLPEDLVPDDI